MNALAPVPVRCTAPGRGPGRPCGTAAPTASGCFGWGRRDLELDVLDAEVGVVRGEAHLAGFLGGANPDGAGAADEREGIVANQLGRAGEFEPDRVAGEGADGVELVCDAKHDAGGVGSIGNERCVIGQKREFLIDTLAGEAARNDLLALDVTVDSQIAPACSDAA